jgi:hypothetical protein
MGCGSSSHAKSEPSVPTGNFDTELQKLTGGDLNHYHRSLQGLSGACKAVSSRTSTCVLYRPTHSISQFLPGLPAPNLEDEFLIKRERRFRF